MHMNTPPTFFIISGNFPESGIAIPTVDRKTLKKIFGELIRYKGKTAKDRLKLHIARMLASEPFLRLFSKEKIVSAEGDIVSQIYNIFEDYIFPICSGSKKFLIPLFLKDSGDLYGYAKVYEKNGNGDQYGRNEVEKLKKLEKIEFKNASAPKILEVGETENLFFYILSTKGDLKKYKGIENAHINWLLQLSQKTGEYIIFEKSKFHERLNWEVDFLKSKFIHSADMIEKLYKKAEDKLNGKTFLFSLTMREFPFYQALYSPNEFFCLDWEYAEYEFPPVFDFFSLAISEAVSREKGSYNTKYAEGVKKTFFRKNREIKKYTKKLFNAYRLDRETSFWFFLLYMLDQLYIHAEAGHNLSAERGVSLLDKMRKTEEFSINTWL